MFWVDLSQALQRCLHDHFFALALQNQQCLLSAGLTTAAILFHGLVKHKPQCLAQDDLKGP